MVQWSMAESDANVDVTVAGIADDSV